MSSSIDVSGDPLQASGLRGDEETDASSSPSSGSSPSTEATVSVLTQALVQSVREAEATFQVKQSRVDVTAPPGTSELLTPEALDAITPRLGVTEATFRFGVDPMPEPLWPEGTGFWASLVTALRRLRTRFKTAWDILRGRPVPVQTLHDVEPSAAPLDQATVQATLTVKRTSKGLQTTLDPGAQTDRLDESRENASS